MDVTEDELLAAIARLLSGTPAQVRVGPGDDAAVVAPSAGELVLTTDVLVEGVHFVRELSSPRDLGFKALAVSLSDLAAMGASPRYALCALGLTGDLDAAWVMEVLGGMRECADGFALSLVGGNLSRASEISLAVTVTGEVAPGRAVRRDGARLGDRLVVTGTLGGSAAGLRLGRLPRSWTEDERAAIRHHVRPIPRIGEGQALGSHGATAMIDLSDGLALDLSRLCRASGVGAEIRVEALPVDPAATPQEALVGGKDYELLATLPPGPGVAEAARDLREGFGVALTDIGAIVEGGITRVDPDDSRSPLAAEGWDHFDGG